MREYFIRVYGIGDPIPVASVPTSVIYELLAGQRRDTGINNVEQSEMDDRLNIELLIRSKGWR